MEKTYKEANKMVKLEKEKLLKMYKDMLRIRRFEETAIELYKRGKIPGLLHPYVGQEAVAVGVCSALEKDDYVISNHRGHGHNIAKGVPPKVIMAELFGKETGVCKGLGGSMHSTDLDAGVIFSTAIVAGGIPIATGVGLGIKLLNKNQVVACFFGDGATNNGSFHEGVNLAAVWKLPVIFVCENNQYAISIPVTKATAVKNLADRAVAYGIPGEMVDGMDVLAVYKATLRAVERARNRGGPTLLVCNTYRYYGHGAYEDGLSYRTEKEVKEWMKKDPIKRLANKLLSENIATEKEVKEIQEEVEAEIKEAVEFAEKSPYPSPELMYKLVYITPGGEE